ncbi:hypothetical protein C0992_011077 [Termitomyces sp. T32_za158]|nr:hypothetical protein C0992_011077 [Termitomyces sp. T32_za158]
MPAKTEGTSELQLVFSDEFYVDGRTFYPGDDPYWEAVDLHYWVCLLLDHDAKYKLTNKFCFTGGYIETSVQLPGANNVVGLWPAVWTMGNLGRAGYGASLEGMWPYSYDACDVGTAPNQTFNGLPAAAVTEGDPYNDGHLSFLPGQRLSRCTCKGESHPGPVHPDGTYVGRAAPEIDIFEALVCVSEYPLTAQLHMRPPGERGRTRWSGIAVIPMGGGTTQMTTSALSWTNPNSYELNGQGFSVYGFEYKPGMIPARYFARAAAYTRNYIYIQGLTQGYVLSIALCTSNGRLILFHTPGMEADPTVQVAARPVPEEPMYIIVNLGISENFGKVDFDHLTFPTQMKVDYIRVYQPADAINYGCNPPNFPTEDYINTYVVCKPSGTKVNWPP